MTTDTVDSADIILRRDDVHPAERSRVTGVPIDAGCRPRPAHRGGGMSERRKQHRVVDRLLVCECGVRVRADKFEAHLRATAHADFRRGFRASLEGSDR